MSFMERLDGVSDWRDIIGVGADGCRQKVASGGAPSIFHVSRTA